MRGDPKRHRQWIGCYSGGGDTDAGAELLAACYDRNDFRGYH